MTHQMRFFQTKYTQSALSVLDKDRCPSERRARLVRQREEVIVEPESVEANNDALD